jgi:hypothetical protein
MQAEKDLGSAAVAASSSKLYRMLIDAGERERDPGSRHRERNKRRL